MKNIHEIFEHTANQIQSEKCPFNTTPFKNQAVNNCLKHLSDLKKALISNFELKEKKTFKNPNYENTPFPILDDQNNDQLTPNEHVRILRLSNDIKKCLYQKLPLHFQIKDIPTVEVDVSQLHQLLTEYTKQCKS